MPFNVFPDIFKYNLSGTYNKERDYVLDSLIFGVLQGIFEWLPISSQGNLVLVMVGLMGMDPGNALNFAIFLHTGTLLSVIVYFREDVIRILKSLRTYKRGYSDENNSLLTFLIISTIITGALGFILYKSIQTVAFTGEAFLGLVGLALIITGILQKISEKGKVKFTKPNFKDSVLMGILQGLAIVPGISRSGITVSAFLLRKYEPKEALRLSFLMSIPAVLGAEIGLALMGSLPEISISEALTGVLTSFIVGLIAIHLLIKLTGKIKFWLFCILIGILALVPFLGFLF
ncbi:MAG: undecaprenyl-diphosphate phosphatase [Candidatus Aenigmarchaeota archaeon]|nr:undecaprenyl-diphosphate phosphatase [Candidatus Aenigmarchaeota archaeon]